MSRSFVIAIIFIGMFGGRAASSSAATRVEGFMTSEGITGRPNATPQGWDDKDDSYPLGEDPRIYLGPLDTGWGAGGVPYHNPPGWYQIPKSGVPNYFPTGTYSLFTLQFNGAPGFSYRTDVELPVTGVVSNVRLQTAAHYSVMYNAAWTEWTAEPWVSGTDFYQTFVATEPYVTRLAVRLAGKSGDHYSMTLNMAIYGVSNGPPSTWGRVSPLRSIYMDGNMDPIIHLLWAPFRSKNVELVPGQMYAARFWRQAGSQSDSFSIVARPDHGDGYAAGQLYSGNTPLDWDAYAYISGGQLGTVVNHASMDLQVGQTGNWSTRFGQTFEATGTSVAAAELMYITGDPTPPVLAIDFQVYDGFGGSALGPAKKCYGVQGFYEARAAAFWREGEVPTTPGQMYYLEMTTPPSGCNVYFMRDNVPGGAYFNRVPKGGEDIMGCIAEYLPPGPKIALNPDLLTPSVEEGGDAAPDTFTVANVGAETLTYTVSEDVSWLSVAPTSGSSNGEQDPITVTYSTSGLGLGIHSEVITVSSSEASNSPKTVTVRITIEPHPGDFDADGDVDQDDFGHLQACFSGAGIAQKDFACRDALLDEDDDVDADDFGIFQACMSGADLPAVYGCGD